MVPTDICIFSIFFHIFSSRIFPSTLLNYNKIHENDIRNSLLEMK